MTAEEFLVEPQSRSAEAFLLEGDEPKPKAAAFLQAEAEEPEFTTTDSPPAERVKGGRSTQMRRLLDPARVEAEGFSDPMAPIESDPELAKRTLRLLQEPMLPEVPKVSGEEMRRALPGLPARSIVTSAPGLGPVIVPSAAAAAAVARVGAGFLDFLSTPLGISSALLGPVAPRVVGGLFAADMARHEPELARAAGEASVTGGEGEKVEANLNLLLNTGLAGVAAMHAVRPPLRAKVTNVETIAKPKIEEMAISPDVQVEIAKLDGEKPSPIAELKAEEFLNEARPVEELQTSGVADQTAGIEALRRELAELNDAPTTAEKKGAAAAYERPPDVLDWMEGQGLRVRKYAKGDKTEVAEEWQRAQRATDKAFDVDGEWPDVAADAYSRATGKKVSTDEFLSEIEGVDRMRKAAAEAFREEWGKTTQDGNFEAEVIGGARKEKTAKVENLGAAEVMEGDRFEANGIKGIVEAVKLGADETVERVTVKFESRYGTRVIDGDATLKIDQGSLERGEAFKALARDDEKFWGETWADRVIEEAKGRVSAGLDPELLAAYAVKGAAVIVRGVRDAGAWAAEMVREYGDAIREHLPEIRRRADELIDKGWQGADKPAAVAPGMGERAFPRQIDASTDISGEVKLQQGPRLYETRSNPVDAASAKAWIDEIGLDTATEAVIAGRTGLHPSVETMVGMEVLKKWGEREQIAALTRDKAAEDLAVRRSVDVSDAVTRRSTDIAQALQAYSAFSRLTPAGMMESARRTIEGAFEKEIGAMRPGLENIKETIRKVNEEVAGGVVNDPAVIKAGEEAVKPAAEQVATTVASKRLARELMNGRILETAKGKAAGISELAGRHFAGEDPARTLQRKLWEDLKIPYDQAKILAKRLEVEFARLVRKEAEKLFTESRRALWKKRQAELLAMARRHFINGEDARTLWEKVREIMKVDEAAAKVFADKLTERFKDLASEKKRAALRKLTLPARVGPNAARGLHEKLIELSNIGALDDAAFDRAIAEKLKLPQWNRELATEVKKRAEAMQKLPEGFRRTRAGIDLMNFIARAGGVKWTDLAWAFWYSNVLSGPMTHAVNAGANALNLTANFGYSLARSPRSARGLTAALWNGLGKGSIEALQLIDSGMVTGTRLGKIEALRPLELAEFKGAAAPLKLWRYVGRAMGAADLVFFKSAEEMRSYAAARKIAAEEGLSGEALEKRTVEVLGQTEEQIAAARATADAEGLEGLDWKRRVAEVIEQSRPGILRDNAKEYALAVTFNGRPYGVLGSVARGIHQIRREVPAVQAIVPFVDIIANVTNEGLNYFPPVGVARALRGHWYGELEGKPITDRAVLFDQWAKATAGGVGLMTLAMLAADGTIEVSGAGPRTPDQRKQLQETGWIPYSIKAGGKYYSYGWTPAAIPVAILGNYLDAQKYKNLEAADAGNRAAYALGLFGKVVMQQSFLSGVADLVTWAERDNTKSAGDSVARGFLRTATSFVVPNAMRQIDRIFDPGVYEANTIEAAVVAAVPFARRLNRPALNVLGEPVSKFVSDRFLSSDRGDALWETLAEKQAWVSVPDRDVVIGDKKDGPGAFRVLSESEYYEFVRTSGQAIRAELMSRIGELRAASPDEAKEIVRQVTTAARDEAKGRF